MHEDTEAARGVAEAASDLGTGESFYEEAAEGLVLAVGSIAGFEENLRQVR